MDGLPNRPYMRAYEIAELLQVSRHSIYRWVREGKLEAIKVGSMANGTIRIKTDSVRRLLEDE